MAQVAQRKPHKYPVPPWSMSDGGTSVCCLHSNEQHPPGGPNSAPGGVSRSLVKGSVPKTQQTQIQGKKELLSALSTLYCAMAKQGELESGWATGTSSKSLLRAIKRFPGDSKSSGEGNAVMNT